MADIGDTAWQAMLEEMGAETVRGRLLWTDRSGGRCYERHEGDRSILLLTGGPGPDVEYVLVGVDDAALR